MSRMFKSSMDSSILDGSATVNDLFESIGLKVLDMWDSEQGDVSSFQNNQHAVNNTTKLERILETPPSQLKPGWSSQLRAIIEEMEPTDFAVYGKQLCMFLLTHQENDDNKLNNTVEAPMSFGDQVSTSFIPISPKSKHGHTPKSKRSLSPKSIKSPYSKYQSSTLAYSQASPPPVPQHPMYTGFPKWLPTMPNIKE